MNTAASAVAELPSDEVLITPAQRMLAQAEALVIDSPEMEQVAADELRAIKRKYSELEEERLGMTRPLDESKKRIMEKYRQPLGYLERAEAAIKGAIGKYRKVLEDQRRERQRLADEEARKARERLEAEARAAREKADKEAAELRRRAEEAAAAGRAAESARLAARAENKVDAAENKVDSLREAAAAIPASVVLAKTQKAAGVHMVKRYAAKVVNKGALDVFVAANPMFRHLTTPDQSALDALARSTKDQFQIPGCELVTTETVSARS